MATKTAKTKKEIVKKVAPLILQRPRVTEKASLQADMTGSLMPKSGLVYTFEIDPRANKIQVKAAVKATYKVTPQKVNIVKLPAKIVFRRGKLGRVPGVKKALVFLKPGDKIDFA